MPIGTILPPVLVELVADTRLIRHPDGEGALIATSNNSPIPMARLTKKGLYIRISGGTFMDNTVSALIKATEIAHPGNHLSIYAGTIVPQLTSDTPFPSTLPVNRIAPIFAGKLYYETEPGQGCQPTNNNGSRPQWPCRSNLCSSRISIWGAKIISEFQRT